MKVLIIGLDGATFDLIKPWNAQGELPTFGMLMENGVYGDLTSTIPPVSSPAWPSFMTGMNPGKHGVFDFVGRREGYRRAVKNARDIKAKTLWRLLSEEEKTCIVVNVPVTYPPEEVKGCIATGMLTPPNACYAYPPEIYEELKRFSYKPGARGITKESSPKAILDYLVGIASKRVEAVLHLMNRFNWEFCMVVFGGTDKIQHYLWQYHKKEILQYYKKIDAFMKELINHAGNETNTILMSDHGFGPFYRFFHVNYFLHELGLLAFKKGASGEYLDGKSRRLSNNLSQRILLKIGITKETIYDTAKRLHLLKVLQKLYRIPRIKLPTTQKSIDWKRTSAFFDSTVCSCASISINLENRESEGTVQKEEYAEFVELIISELLKVEDPETGQKIVQDVFRREDLYHGLYVSKAPDITFLTNNLEYVATNRIYGDSLVSEPVHKGGGTHRMNGIFVAHGPDIKDTGKEILKARIIDLAPTVLHMFGLEIPEDMDGNVLTRIFKPDSRITKRKIKHRKITKAERIRERIRRWRARASEP